jgi:hypothetical protein
MTYVARIDNGRPLPLDIRATSVEDVPYIAETWHRSVLSDSRRQRRSIAPSVVAR